MVLVVDITRAELLKYALETVKLQQGFMVIMVQDCSLNVEWGDGMPDLLSLLQTLEGGGGGLKEQYQRMEQAKPLPTMLSTRVEYRSMPGIWNSNGPVSTQGMFSPNTGQDFSSSAQTLSIRFRN